MNRRSDALGPLATRTPPLRFLLFFFCAAALFFAAGCRNKSAPASNVGIRNITREFVFAARNASSGRAEVGMRPEYAARQPGKQQTLAADHIYITVPLTKAGAPDLAAQDAIEAELARVAEFQSCVRCATGSAAGARR